MDNDQINDFIVAAYEEYAGNEDLTRFRQGE